MRRFTAIAALCAFSLANLGCSKDPEPIVVDVDMSVTDTNGQDLAVADSGGTDTGADTGPDMTLVNPEFCDPIAQDCVEPDASVCAIVFPPNNMPLNLVCRESLGNVGTDEPCTRPNDVAGEDDCAPGHLCSGYGFPTAEPQQRACRSLCRSHAECSDTARCIQLQSFGTLGTCFEMCDPRANDCVEGSKCSIFYSGADQANYWLCTNDAGASVGDPCTGSQDCGAGQLCPYDINPAVRTCQAFCADDMRCADGGACSPEGVNPGYGMCQAVDWSCAGTPWPAASATDSIVTVTVTGAGAGLEDAVVKACAADDTDCAAPIAMSTTGPNGNVMLTVPTGATGFDGYFEVTADGYLTELLYAAAPIGEATAVVEAIMAPSGTPASPFAWTGGLTLDPARGHIVSVITPCTASGGGAQVTLASSLSDGSTTTGYLSEIAATGLLDSALTATTINGRAAMANHPAGTPVLTYTNAAGTDVATRRVVIRPGALSFVWAAPTP